MDQQRPILVTGAGGFIGQHLVAALRADGHRVRALVRRRVAEFDAAGVETVVGDLTDPTTVRQSAAGVRAVFHLAGKLFAPGSDARLYEQLHVDAMSQLFEACLAAGPLERFVLCSTTGVHGPTGETPAREDDPLAPQNAYEASKARAEQAAIDIAQRHSAPLVIARPGLVYGPGDLHLLGWYRSIRDGFYRVVGHGTNHLHPIYISDLVDGMLRCASHGTADGRAYHLVGVHAVTMRDLSDAIGAAIGRPVPAMHLPTPVAYAIGAAFELLPIPRRKLPLSRSRVKFLTQNRAYDGTRARDELGFVPAVKLTDGLVHTVAWYREMGLL